MAKIYHVYAKDGYNDRTDLWTADHDKALEQFRKVLDYPAMKLDDKITIDFYCYIKGEEVHDSKDGLAKLNAKLGTAYKDWKEAAFGEGGFTGEGGCCDSEAYIKEYEGDILPDGTALVKMPVTLDKVI
jgi:hypothetical protein